MNRSSPAGIRLQAETASETTHETSDLGRTPRVPSEALLGHRGELIIVHAGREYRLRRTSLGKLMLTA